MGERVAPDILRLCKITKIIRDFPIFNYLFPDYIRGIPSNPQKSKNQEQTAAHKKMTLFEKIKLIAIINLEIFGICVLFSTSVNLD